MIKIIDISNRKQAEDVLTLQIPSYKVEAEIIDSYEIPPLKDTVYTLQHCEETFIGYYENEELCGAISIKVIDDEVDNQVFQRGPILSKNESNMLKEFANEHERINGEIVKVAVEKLYEAKNILPFLEKAKDTGYFSNEHFTIIYDNQK